MINQADERVRSRILEPHTTNPGAIEADRTKLPPIKGLKEVLAETDVTQQSKSGKVKKAKLKSI
jgi:hypothetical protein